MSTFSQLRVFLESDTGQETLLGLYGGHDQTLLFQHQRYLSLLSHFESDFPGHTDVEVCSVPGRTEVGGNHTDHENGRVLAAAVTLDIIGAAARNGGETIRIHSEGYAPLEIGLTALELRPRERNTPGALVRGIAQYLRQSGAAVGGFDVCFTSNVPGGAGLSSSASFEVLVAEIISILFNKGQLEPLTLANAGHFAETEYFGKPCGLMDQLTSVVGGFVTIDFADPIHPAVQQVAFDLETSGHDLIITETGGSHAGLTDEYAAIRLEQHAVARFFGVSVLREVDEERFRSSLPELRREVGDRAILRAFHFFADNQRVVEQVQALEGGDFEHFLELVRQSGDSSWRLLQNCYSNTKAAGQGIPLALALSAQLLGSSGAWRVHGGGFAGTVQAFVPRDLHEVYVTGMERVFGGGTCRPLTIRSAGAIRLPVPE